MSAGQYFDAKPAVPTDRGEVTLALPDFHLRLATDRGVFSHSAVDAGTRFLLQEAPLPSGESMLDLGCGYGPIALTMARRARAATVWAVDVNERAIDLCRENAVTNDCPNVRAMTMADVPTQITFDTIWSNPPIRIGKSALHDLLLTWLARLSPQGIAVLVVQKHLGADSLAHWLADHHYTVDRFASRQGYRLLAVRPEPLP